jgi:hypothetical protein
MSKPAKKNKLAKSTTAKSKLTERANSLKEQTHWKSELHKKQNGQCVGDYGKNSG